MSKEECTHKIEIIKTQLGDSKHCINCDKFWVTASNRFDRDDYHKYPVRVVKLELYNA